MAIIVGGKKFDPKENVSEKPTQKVNSDTTPKAKETKQKLGNDWQKQNIQIDKYTFDKNKTYLVVNGEVHELRKKSAFLMDMILN